MVEFNKLIVLPCDQGIYLDVNVLDMQYFENVYLDSIIIDTQDTFDSNGPSKSPVYTYTVEGDKKNIQLTIKASELLVNNMNNTMFFVYIVTKGDFTADVPCGCDSRFTLGVCVNTEPIYNRSIKLLQEAYDTCNVPRYLIDFILRFEAFKLCLKTRNFTMAIAYWKRFWNMIEPIKNNKCYCYG